MEPRSLESKEVEERSGKLIASWAPSVQNRLGPAIDISSWNIEDEDNDGHNNDDEEEEDDDDLEDIGDGWEVTLCHS